MARDFNHKYKFILANEESWAKGIAYTIVKPRKISVWEFLIPIIFILSFIKENTRRDNIVQNIIFTKKMALEAALKITQGTKSHDEAFNEIKNKTEKLLHAKDTQGIYSDEIRQNQLKEVEFLIGHYQRLLKANGDDFHALVIDAYKTKKDYIDFFDKLEKLEKNVNQAATNVLGPRADLKFMAQMDEAKTRIQNEKAQKIFES